MIVAYLNQEKLQAYEINANNLTLLKEAVWIDLISPTKIEEKQVEETISLSLPTRDEMSEIEISSRLYKENNAVFMIGLMIAQSDTPTPVLDPITIVLTPRQLITIRYVELKSFKIFIAELNKFSDNERDVHHLFYELLNVIVDRLADILEVIGNRLDNYSQTIFQTDMDLAKLNYKELMQKIGQIGDLNSKARDSLVSFNRVISFYEQVGDLKTSSEGIARLSTISRDIISLSDHTDSLSSKVIFLLESTLGLVNIDQNNVIKILSVAAVIFLPPTLVASIYGMNFHFIPELSWKYGYLFAIGMIAMAAWLPYKYFKYRKWL